MPEVKHGCILKIVTGDYVAPTKVLVFRMRMSIYRVLHTEVQRRAAAPAAMERRNQSH